MVAPNGARRGKSDHPALPVALEELAATAERCAAAGATALHFHVRDAGGAHTLDPERCEYWYRRLEERLGARMLLQLTTEAAGRFAPEEQMECVRVVQPGAVSLAPRELQPGFGEPSKALRRFLDWIAERGIAPQYILYDPEEVDRFQEWRARGYIPQERPFVLFVLGRYREPGRPIEPRSLLDFLARHDPACPWMVCAFDREETACLMLAATLGGHLRVGFENSLLHGNGRPARDNAERVRAIARGLALIGRPRAGLRDTRLLFGDRGLSRRRERKRVARPDDPGR